MSASPGGKKSWRQTDKEPPPAAPAPSETPAAPVGPEAPASKPAAQPKRFRGGRTTVALESKSPTWFRLLLPISALIVIVVALGVLFWLLNIFGVRPTILAWSVTAYQAEAPAIPTNDFADDDVVAILRENDRFDPMAKFENVNLQTGAGFARIFDAKGEVPTIEKTLVVYVSAHGVSRDDKPYLLVAGRPGDGEFRWQAYPASEILEAMATCPSPHKLLILDVTRIDADFEIGLLGNDFVELFKTQWNALEARSQSHADDGQPRIHGSLWVLISSDFAERSWTSRRFGQSPFGRAVAYALRGAETLDTGDLKGRPQKDLYISARELTDFVKGQVSGWAPAHRGGVTQTPILLDHGDDFPLVSVDHRIDSPVRFDNVWRPNVDDEKGGIAPKIFTPPAEPMPLAKVLEEVAKEKEKLQKAVADNKAGEATVQDVEASVVAVLDSLWWLRDEIQAQAPSTMALRPNETTTFEEGLLSAERRLLGGQILDTAESLLDLGESIGRAASDGQGQTPIPWSIVSANDPEGQKKRDLLDKFVDDPGANKKAFLEEAADFDFVEAALLRAIVQDWDYLPQEEWVDAPAVKAAYLARKAAEERGGSVDPRLLSMVQQDLDETDQLRREGERALLLGRGAQARDQLSRAKTNYDNLRGRVATAREDWNVVRETVRRIVHYIRWIGEARLGDDQSDQNKRDEEIDLIERVLRGVREFEPNRLADLAQHCRDLRKLAEQDAAESYRRGWRRQRAAMELGFLDAKNRSELRKRLLAPPDADPLNVAPGGPDRRTDLPANPFPLSGFVQLLGGPPDLAEELARLGPMSTSEVRLRHILRNEEVRKQRAQAGQRVLEIMYGAMNSQLAFADESDPHRIWLAEMRQLALAPVKAAKPGINPKAEDGFFEQLEKRYRKEWYAWQWRRLEADNQNLPRRVYDKPLKVLQPLAEPKIVPAPGAPGLSPEQFSVPPVGTIDTRVTVQGVPSSATSVRLTLDWERSKSQIQMSSTSAQPASVAENRLVLELQAGSEGNRWVAPLKIVRKSDASLDPSASLPVFAWLTASVGGVETIHWLPMSVRLEAPKRKQAELVFHINQQPATPDSEGNVVETLYPNQGVLLSLFVQQNEPCPPLRVELESGVQRAVLSLPESKTQGRLPVPLPADDFSLPVDRGEVSVRLMKEDGELLDSRTLRLQPSPWSIDFSVDFDVDADENLLSNLRVVRRRPMRAKEIPVVFRIEGAEDAVRKLALNPATQSETSPAVLPIPPTIGPDFSVSVDIANVPSAFRFEVRDGAKRRTGEPTIEFLRPNDGAVYPTGSSPPVELLVHGVGPADPSSLFVGIDDRFLPVRTYCGRSSRMTLAMNRDLKSLELYWAVGSVTVDLTRSWTSGSQVIQAKLERDREMAANAERQIYLMSKTNIPKLQFTSPTSDDEYSMGQVIPVTVVLAGSDKELAGGIHHVEFVFSKTTSFADGKVESKLESGKPGRDVRLAGDKVAVGLLPTEETLLTEGRWYIVARPCVQYEPGADGKAPEPVYGPDASVGIRVVKPADPAAVAGPPPKPKKPWVLKGKVKGDGKDIWKATVKAEGPGPVESKETDVNGNFELTGNVPGLYKISATRDISSPKYVTTTPVEVDLKEGATVPLEVKVVSMSPE